MATYAATKITSTVWGQSSLARHVWMPFDVISGLRSTRGSRGHKRGETA